MPKRINSMEMSLKLIIDQKSGRVLFAEAGKDVVDFIFSFLFMPLSSIVKLLAKQGMEWSLDSIYESAKTMAETQLNCRQSKSLILNLTFGSPSKILTGSSSTTHTSCKYYKCSNCLNFTDTPSTLCPSCKKSMTTELTFVRPNRGREFAEAAINKSGFVKGPVTCTITDDLTVMPVSSVATLALLNKHDIKDASLLVECTVKLGTKEGLELLKASLKSKTVLTDVFLGTEVIEGKGVDR